MAEQTSFFRIRVKSPLHIGCNEVYEPTSFVINEDAAELISFDTSSLLEKLDDKALAKFSGICAKGTIESLLELYKFIRSQLSLAEGEHIPVAPTLVEHYRKTMELSLNRKKIQQELNNFVINRTAFNPLTSLVYIPGSSIKGAIRNAILNHRHAKRPIHKKSYERMNFQELRNESRALQRKILGGAFHTDPLRMVKVSDFIPIGEVKRRIIYVVDQKKRQGYSGEPDLYQILEVIEPETEFLGSISVETPLNAPKEKDSIHLPVTMSEIEKALISFFGAEKKREDREVKAIGSKPIIMKYGNSSTPLRIGRHSGAECITVSGHRHIKIMQGKGNKPKFKDHATTIWLASDSKRPNSNKYLQPLGWTLLEKLSQDTWISLKNQAELLQEEAIKKLSNKADRIRALKEERLRLQQEQQAAEEQKRKEEEALKEKQAALAAQWEVADEIERDLAVLRGEEFATTQIEGDIEQYINTQIWPKIESAPPEHQKALAMAFRERWQAENKWKVKPKKKKQWKKVQKVKDILADD